jgi:hypothetical protein
VRVVADEARADSAATGLCDRAGTFLFVSPIDALDNALARADTEFNDLGAVSQKALGELTDVYLESTLGHYRVKGHLPDSWGSVAG